MNNKRTLVVLCLAAGLLVTGCASRSHRTRRVYYSPGYVEPVASVSYVGAPPPPPPRSHGHKSPVRSRHAPLVKPAKPAPAPRPVAKPSPAPCPVAKPASAPRPTAKSAPKTRPAAKSAPASAPRAKVRPAAKPRPAKR